MRQTVLVFCLLLSSCAARAPYVHTAAPPMPTISLPTSAPLPTAEDRAHPIRPLPADPEASERRIVEATELLRLALQDEPYQVRASAISRVLVQELVFGSPDPMRHLEKLGSLQRDYMNRVLERLRREQVDPAPTKR